MRECAYCRRLFEQITNNQLYCSKKCRKAASSKREWQRIRNTKPCKACGKPFIPTQEYRVYCSDACRPLLITLPYKRICENCGIEFDGRKNQRFCSANCQKGRKPPEKKRVSQINEINAKARAEGLSYGQYKALEWAKVHKVTI